MFIEKAMQNTGINRTNLVGVLTHLIRTGQAKDQGDAIKRLEAGEFDKLDIEEQIIRSYQTVHPEPEIVVSEQLDDTQE